MITGIKVYFNGVKFVKEDKVSEVEDFQNDSVMDGIEVLMQQNRL